MRFRGKGGRSSLPTGPPPWQAGLGLGQAWGALTWGVSSQVQACSGQSQERAAESPWGPLAIREAAANLNLAARVFRKVRQETLRFGPAGGRVLDLCPMQDGPHPLLALPLPHPEARRRARRAVSSLVSNQPSLVGGAKSVVKPVVLRTLGLLGRDRDDQSLCLGLCGVCPSGPHSLGIPGLG